MKQTNQQAQFVVNKETNIIAPSTLLFDTGRSANTQQIRSQVQKFPLADPIVGPNNPNLLASITQLDYFRGKSK